MTCYHPNLRQCPDPRCFGKCGKLLCEDCGADGRDSDGNQTFNLITPIDIGVDPAPRPRVEYAGETVIIVDITNLSNVIIKGTVIVS